MDDPFRVKEIVGPLEPCNEFWMMRPFGSRPVIDGR